MVPDHPPVRIALGISGSRNRDLFTALLADQEPVEINGAVPEGTDLCVVDEVTLANVGDVLADWRESEHPTFAPVLLLVDSDVPDPWDRYADVLADRVDTVMQIPASRSAVGARIQTLLEMRAMSRRLASEQQLTERVFETSPLAKVVLDTEGTILRVNQRATELFGASKQALTGRDYAAEVPAVDTDGTPIPDADLPFARVLETGEPVYNEEYIFDRPDGDRRWLSVNVAPILDERDEVEYLIGAFEDITVRRHQEQQLERQLDLFQKAQRIADVGAWEYDVQAEEGFWTETVSHIHGLPPDVDPSPELSLEYFHPEDRPTIERAFERAISEGESYDHELRLIDADGNLRWVRLLGEPQYEDGELVRVRGTMQDITDRKERNLELRQMTHAVDHAPVGVTLSDPDQEDNPLVYVNEAFVELTGYSREAAVGRNCRYLQGENTDPETVAEIRRAIDAEEPVSMQILNYRADGSEFWNQLEIAPVRNEDGEVVNYIGFQQDVTEQVERQRQLDVLDRYLRHNLRNKMNVIQGMAELIQAEAGPRVTEYADRIEATVDGLLSDVEKEREITEMLKESPEEGPVELMALVRRAAEAVRREHPSATVSVTGPDTLSVLASDRLSVALEELVGNAIEHNDAESPTATIAVAREGDEVAVRIADDGPGIPEMEVDILRGVREETSIQHSQGLGLWLIHLLVRRSGGTVRFEDNDPRGSVVTVVLTPAESEQ